jgi:heme/copper-type cytochrome/quinol oxidase subunit 3
VSHPAVLPPGNLPRDLSGARSPLLYAVALLLAIEGVVFALLITSYFYLGLAHEHWPPIAFDRPDLTLPSLANLVLLLSLAPAHLATRGVAAGRQERLVFAWPLGLLLVAAYVLLNTVQYARQDHDWTVHAYTSVDWTMGGYGMLHAITLLLFGGTVWVLGLKGHFTSQRRAGLQAALLYWYFVAIGSLLLYAAQHLSPYLLAR